MKVNNKISGALVPDAKVVGHRIREVRGFDLTQEEFAQRLGISQSQLSKYERGVAWPAAEVLIKLRAVLGISIDWLLTGEKKERQ
jgi:transcriptional regulator with XRE-family HTH domain